MAIEDITEIVPEVSTITPFQKLVLSIGEIPTNYLDSMSYGEQVTWFCMFLQEKVLPVVNQHSEKILEIINYLNNLDLQDEVNNKLDEMAEDGTLEEIISKYIEIITPETFGAKGDGETDDTQAWQDAIDYCIENNLTLYGTNNKTYLVNKLTIDDDLNIDGKYCILKSNNDDVIEINNTNLTNNYIKNINIINVPANKIGIYCNPARRYVLENINMNNIGGTGIKIGTYGGGILVKDYKITGDPLSVQSVGLDTTGTSDGVYKDIIMVDIFTGLKSSGGNYYENVHPWLATASLFRGSTAFEITGGQAFFDKCYPDTYQYNFKISNNAYVNLEQCKQYHNINVANNNTIENAGGKTYLFYYDNANTSINTMIHNSYFLNPVNDNIKYAYKTNLESPLLNIDRTSNFVGMADNEGFKYAPLTFTPTDGHDVYDSKCYFNNNICWYNIRMVLGTSTANTEVDLGYIDTNFLPASEMRFVGYYGTGALIINGPALIRIQANGHVTAKVPEDTGANTQVVFNISYFATKLV